LILAFGATLFTVASAPAGSPAVQAGPFACDPCGDGDEKRLAALSVKLTKLKHEIRGLEARLRRQQAAGDPVRVRRDARRLSHLKKGVQDLHKQIAGLKARLAAQHKAARLHARARTRYRSSDPSRKRIAPTPHRYRSNVRIVKRVPMRTTVTLGTPSPEGGVRCDCDCHKKKGAAKKSAVARKAATSLDRAAARIKAQVARLMKEKALLERRIKAVHAQLAKAKRALMDLKRKHQLEARRLQAEARRRLAVRQRAQARSRTSYRAPVARRQTQARRAVRARTGADHGARVLEELHQIRRDVHRIAGLLEKALHMIHQAHQAEHPVKAKAKSKRKKKRAQKRDLRTL
jgi:hypothetical protein